MNAQEEINYLRSQVEALEQLLSVYEKETIEKSQKLEQTLADLQNYTQQLSHSEAALSTLRSMVNSMGDGVIVVDKQGGFLFLNDTAHTLLDIDETCSTLREWSDHWHLYTSDQTTPCSLDLFPLTQAIQGNPSKTTELWLQQLPCDSTHADDSNLWFSINAQPLYDENKEVQGGVAVFHNITAQKQNELALRQSKQRYRDNNKELKRALAELKQAQGQLIQTEKMSSLGQMVAGIAHEINNPISFIQGNLKPINEYIGDLIDLIETYETEYPQPTEVILEKRDEIDLEFLLEDTRRILGSLKMGTERVRDIVVSLRNYSRLDEAAIKDVEIHEGINNTLLILTHRIKHGVDVVKDYGNLPLVRCSPSQLNQVFTNIMANALDAMFEADSQPKRLTITTRTLPENQVQISFRDSGPGMTPEIKAKIFDPFFTTKAVGKGTGMGMGICFKIIEQHEGSIDVITEVGQGTELVLTLPVDPSKTAPQPLPLTPA